jgi:hypothetical protein
MATPGSSDQGVVDALNSAGNTGIPDPTKIAADAAAKAANDAAVAESAALAAAAGEQGASPEAVAAVKAWQASPTAELRAAAVAAVAADKAAAAAKVAADPATQAAQLQTLQDASTAALKASAAAPDDQALKAAYDAAVKAVNDFVSKPPAPAQGSEPKVDDKKPPETVKLTVPEDKTVSEAEVQKLELFAQKHKFSQAQADALLASARENELARRVQYTNLQKANLTTIQSDVELGGTVERVNLTLERARIGAKHLFTAEELLEMEKSGDANKPALVRACLRHYNMALASPSLVNGDPIKKDQKKLDARNPDDLAAAFREDAAKQK